MARLRSTTFVGSPPRDVVTDASIFRRWLKAAAGDIALVTDLVTGANSTTPITHTGAPDGCQLRLPKAAQHIDRSLILRGSTIAEQPMVIIGVPVFIPAGETGPYRLTVTAPTGRGNTTSLVCEVRDTSWGLNYGPFQGVYDTDDTEVVTSNGPRRDTARWNLTLSAGIQYLIISRQISFQSADPYAQLIDWALEHDRTYAGESNGLSITGSAAVGDIYQTTASTFSPSNVHDTYDEEVAIDGPLSGYVLARLNRHINALWEYVTGSKIPGNDTYQTTTLFNNDRSSFTAEGLLEFPMVTLALGSCLYGSEATKPALNDYATLTPTDGLLDWHMHPITRSTTNRTLISSMMKTPSFRTSPSDLKCSVLMNSPSGAANAANWRFRVSSPAGDSAAVAPVQIGSTTFLVATVVAIPFNASSDEIMQLQIANTATAAGLGSETLDVLGCCFYFDP